MRGKFYSPHWLLQRGRLSESDDSPSTKGTGQMGKKVPLVEVWTDTIFLQRAQRLLSPTEREEAVVFTGICVPKPNGRVIVPTSMFMPKYRVHSVGGVEAVPESMAAIDKAVASAGLEKLKRGHSHPCTGVRGCDPSKTDIEDQKYWESVGYQMPSMIFTRCLNGTFFVRVFTCDKLRLRVRIHGRHWRVEENVFEIPQEL